MTEELAPRRHLDLDGTYNLRDIGGYVTSDGSVTRWKTLLRSDSLHRLPSASQAALIGYGLRTVIDLRRTYEVDEAPNVFADSLDVRYYRHNLTGDRTPADTTTSAATEEKGSRMLVENYTRYLDLRRAQFVETLATLAAPGALPALVHCAVGKDRTGTITALVLGIARVPAETIAEDYALSARYLLRRYVNGDLFAYERETLATPRVPSSGYTWEDYRT